MHTVIPYTHTMLVYVIWGRGRLSEKYGALRVVFQQFSGEYFSTQWFREGTQCLYVLKRAGGAPHKHGAPKVIFQEFVEVY